MLKWHLWIAGVGLAILSGCRPNVPPTTATSPPAVTTVPSPSASDPQPMAPVAAQPPPLPEVPAAVRIEIELLGARIIAIGNGYNIELRNKLGFTDKDIDVILQCPQVVDLTMEKVSITDEGLAKLKPLSQLSRLILNDCPISSQGLQTLADLPLCDTLISLGLRGTRLQDGDLATIQKFTRLERLDISHTAVTDLSLPDLQNPTLRVLNVAGTQITAPGLEQFQEKQPQLMIKR